MPDEKQPTQLFVEVEDIRDGVLVLKSGALRQILMVGGVNFDLKSEEEQGVIIGAYQNFLNSLDFSLQFIIHSRRLNIEDYLKKLNERRDQEANELLKNQIGDYVEFVRAFVESNAIMDKNFFVVVPYDPVQLVQETGSDWLSFVRGKTGKEKPEKPGEEPADRNLEANLGQLTQRTDQVITGLNQIGLRAIPLNAEEVTELLYNLYNPGTVEKKGLAISK